MGSDGYGDLCSGVCLINSAGRLTARQPDEVVDGEPQGSKYWLREWKWARMTVGRVLLRQLQGRVLKTLNAVYPTNPLDEGSELPEEILRASLDFGAAEVIASGLIIPESRSLRDMLKAYEGPLLVFNGVLDPLGNVRERTELLRDVYPAATVVTVDAG